MKATSTIPQSAACSAAISAARRTLAEYGFRLPSCHGQPTVRFEEWDMMPAAIGRGVSDARGAGNSNEAGGVGRAGESRRRGFIDPPVHIRPAHQIISSRREGYGQSGRRAYPLARPRMLTQQHNTTEVAWRDLNRNTCTEHRLFRN